MGVLVDTFPLPGGAVKPCAGGSFLTLGGPHTPSYRTIAAFTGAKMDSAKHVVYGKRRPYIRVISVRTRQLTLARFPSQPLARWILCRPVGKELGGSKAQHNGGAPSSKSKRTGQRVTKMCESFWKVRMVIVPHLVWVQKTKPLPVESDVALPFTLYCNGAASNRASCHSRGAAPHSPRSVL